MKNQFPPILVFIMMLHLALDAHAAWMQSHNDYSRNIPLHDALNARALCIEADIHLSDGKLLVAHDFKDTTARKTLESLYLEPLAGRVRANSGMVYDDGSPAILLIDIKSEALSTYLALHRILEQYSDMLTTFRGDDVEAKAITVIISGRRPMDFMATQPVRYAAIDGRIEDINSNLPRTLMPWISDDWRKSFKWNGQGNISVGEQQKLEAFVKKAHGAGRWIRFWNTKDQPAFWRVLADAGVDIIGTDKPGELQQFLKKDNEKLPPLFQSSLMACGAHGTDASWLVRSGEPRAVVLLAADATPSDEFAARELINHVESITGANLRIVREPQYAPETGPCVSIGRTDLGRAALTDAEAAEMEDDEFTYFSSGGNAFFVGGKKRGSLYAVYEFLENLGVRWYTSDYTVIPRYADVPMPARRVRAKPGFWYRDQWWNSHVTHEWLARMRVNGSNGQNHSLPETMGGSMITVHNCHSFHSLVPDENFETHRDWYAQKESGKRDGKRELCLTNPELRAFVAQRVLSDLREREGRVDNYWVSQNDGGRSGCFCERCASERLAHGGEDRWSANIISFVNFVAGQVQPEFPRVRIKTLAYSYTKDAPDAMKAAENVMVEVCGNFRPGEDDPQRQRVKAWSEIANNISVYTYGGSNYGYWWPYPYVAELGWQCAWAREIGVTAFYVQGTALGHGSGLVDLKAYISARMAWDPSRDMQQQIHDFCNGFYGPAGRYIIEYIDWYSSYISANKMEMDGGWGDAERWRKWVDREAMRHSDAFFQKALAATRHAPSYSISN